MTLVFNEDKNIKKLSREVKPSLLARWTRIVSFCVCVYKK